MTAYMWVLILIIHPSGYDGAAIQTQPFYTAAACRNAADVARKMDSTVKAECVPGDK